MIADRATPKLPPMTSPGAGAQVRLERVADGQATVLWVNGEIDLVTASALEEGLDSALDAAGAGALVVVDLTGVTFLASAGLAALMRAHVQTRERGHDLVIAALGSGSAMRSITVSGLADTFTVVESTDAALLREPRNPA